MTSATMLYTVTEVGDDQGGRPSVSLQGSGTEPSGELFVTHEQARWFAARLYTTITVTFEGEPAPTAPTREGGT